METTDDHSYEEHAAAFQCLEIARLNEVLKEHGITDPQQRQAICSAFAFSSGNFLDQGWFQSEGRQLYPTLCFAERPCTPEVGLGAIERLHLPSSNFSFHEYAGGNSYWYFKENGESTESIPTGVAGQPAQASAPADGK